jgi:hypothetical protein
MNTTTKISSKSGFQKPTSPQALQDNAEHGATQAKAASEQMTTAATTASDMVNRNYASAMKSASDYNAMLIDFTLANANHAFSFFQRLPNVRSPADFAELSADHARKQAAAWSDQAQRLTKAMSWKTAPADNANTP